MTHAIQDQRVAAFRGLHESGCFVIPNPWDLGTARVLQQLGFQALATTSAGFAWSLGRADSAAPLEQTLTHARQLVEVVSIPVSVDFEDCFAEDPAGVEKNVRAVIATGVAGFSIEDSTRSGAEPLHDFTLAVERVAAAVEEARRAAVPPVVTARTEGFRFGRPDLDETVRRLTAFADAGADCLYAPSIRSDQEIATVVKAVAPKPVNVLVGSDFTTVAKLAALGVRRISVGGGLARVAWGAFLAAAEEIASEGSFVRLGKGVPFAALDDQFSDRNGS